MASCCFDVFAVLISLCKMWRNETIGRYLKGLVFDHKALDMQKQSIKSPRGVKRDFRDNADTIADVVH